MGETGPYSLTNDESPALIHLGQIHPGNDETRPSTLERLKPPQQQDAPA